MNKTCRWYDLCPLKRYYKEGRLDEKWIKNYCKGNYKACVRYQMEEQGTPHPDNMLPNGKIDEKLK